MLERISAYQQPVSVRRDVMITELRGRLRHAIEQRIIIYVYKHSPCPYESTRSPWHCTQLGSHTWSRQQSELPCLCCSPVTAESIIILHTLKCQLHRIDVDMADTVSVAKHRDSSIFLQPEHNQTTTQINTPSTAPSTQHPTPSTPAQSTQHTSTQHTSTQHGTGLR